MRIYLQSLRFFAGIHPHFLSLGEAAHAIAQLTNKQDWWILFGVLEITKKIRGVLLFPLEIKEFCIRHCFAF